VKKKINEEDFTLICGNIKDVERIFDEHKENSSSSESQENNSEILAEKQSKSVPDKYLLPIEIFK
jgi:hypothetical protein